MLGDDRLEALQGNLPGLPMLIESAEADLEYWYQRYAHCLETGEWPGYPDEPIYLGAQVPVAEIVNDEYSNF